jgi:hypothetical protein
MRAWIHAFALIIALCIPSVAFADVQTGKVMMVMENQLAVIDAVKNESHRFDISSAAIYRNGLLVQPAALASGDWVTVTSELQEGRLVATLVEAASDR